MVLLLLQLIGAFLWHTPFISSAAGLFQCLGQGFLASLTLQSELGVLCQRYFPGYEFYGNSYANNGIETITPDYFLINVISAYPHCQLPEVASVFWLTIFINFFSVKNLCLVMICGNHTFSITIACVLVCTESLRALDLQRLV